MYDLISKIENITSFTQQLICFATASNLSSECLVRHTSVKNGFAHNYVSSNNNSNFLKLLHIMLFFASNIDRLKYE